MVVGGVGLEQSCRDPSGILALKGICLAEVLALKGCYMLAESLH